MCKRLMCHWYLWRPVLVKIVVIKLPHKSVFSVIVLLFMSLLCIFIGGTIFFKVVAYFFSSMNYFNLVWLQFFVGITNEFFTRTANYFWLVLQIIFYSWYWELVFSVSWIYFLAYNTLRACDWGGLALLFWLVRWPFWKLCRCYPKECQGETLSEKETKEVFTFCYKIWKES